MRKFCIHKIEREPKQIAKVEILKDSNENRIAQNNTAQQTERELKKSPDQILN